MKKERIFNYIQSTKYWERLPNFKEKKTQAFTTLAFTLVAFSFFGFFSINPTLSTIAQLQKQLEDSHFVNEELKRKIVNLRTLQTKYSLIQSDIPSIVSAIPSSPSIPLFVAQIQALGVKDQVTINRVQIYEVELTRNKNNLPPSAQEAQDAHSIFEFTIDISGTNSSIATFLSSVIDFQRIVTIDTFTVTQDSSHGMRLVFKGKAYFKS